MHIDFILCNPTNMNVLCAIELNDKSHNEERRIRSDSKKKKALKDANIILHEIPVREKSNKDFIFNKIFQAENSEENNSRFMPREI